MACKHRWHYSHTWAGEGEPKMMIQRLPNNKVRTWVDARQVYAEFLCDICGKIKDTPINPPKPTNHKRG